MANSSIEGRHYAFLAFLTLLNVMNFVDRKLLASFANFIVPDLRLTNTEFGLLTGLAFITFYVVMGLFMGVLADMVHRPRLVAVGLLVWSALTAVSGAARGFWSLAVPRMFIGVGESILTPTSMSMLADRFPTARLGFAAGFYYMGVPIGVGVSLLIVGYLGPTLGWRNCFYLLGAIGSRARPGDVVREERRRAATCSPTPREPGRTCAGSSPRRGRRCVNRLRCVTRSSAVCSCTLRSAPPLTNNSGSCTSAASNAPKSRASPDGSAWSRGVLGNLFGGIGGDALQRRTGMGRATFLCWIMLILAPINLSYRLVPPDSVWFWIGVFFGMFQLGSFYGPTFSAVQELVPPQIRGTVVAFYILTLNFIGLGFGITAGGFLIDYLAAQFGAGAVHMDAGRVHRAVDGVYSLFLFRRQALSDGSRTALPRH